MSSAMFAALPCPGPCAFQVIATAARRATRRLRPRHDDVASRTTVGLKPAAVKASSFHFHSPMTRSQSPSSLYVGRL